MEAGYVFLKTHKTASLSVYHMLNAVLATTHGVRQCDPRHEHSATAVPNPPVVLNPPVVPNPSIGCRSCLSHDSLRPVALAVRAPRVVGAHCVAQQVCPFWVPNRHVYTLIVLRNPIDRAESRYHYERAQGWCRKHAAAHGADAGCASDHLAFDAWCLLSDEVMSRRRLFRVSQDQLLAETTWLLGGNDEAQARRVLGRIDVVGVTERLPETLRVLAGRWHLPEHELRAQLGHYHQRAAPRAALNASHRHWLLNRSVLLQRETRLHALANALLTRALASTERPPVHVVPTFGDCDDALVAVGTPPRTTATSEAAHASVLNMPPPECTRAASDVRLWTDTANATFASRWADNRPFLLPDPATNAHTESASVALCLVTKTASTAVKRMLLAEIYATRRSRVHEHDWRRCPHGIAAFPRLSPVPSRSILVVRHPLHRLASAYAEIHREHLWHRLLPLVPPNASFERLVHALVRTHDPMTVNPHYRPLVATCGLMAGRTYDVVLRYEDTKRMTETLHRFLAPSQPKLVLRTSQRAMERARRLYSEPLARLMNRCARLDLRMLGYRPWFPTDAQIRWL